MAPNARASWIAVVPIPLVPLTLFLVAISQQLSDFAGPHGRALLVLARPTVGQAAEDRDVVVLK